MDVPYVSKLMLIKWSANRCRLAKVSFLRGNSPASPAGKLHEGKFILADVFGIRFRFTTKITLGFIATRVAQMSRFSSYSTAIFTRIFHFLPPYMRLTVLGYTFNILHISKM